MSDIPSFRDDSVTIEAWIDGEKVEEIIRFTEPLSVSELANIKIAWEAGVRRGKGLCTKSVRADAEPKA